MFTVKEIQQWGTDAQINGKWVPARPLVSPFVFRLRAAWSVLVGRADAVRWPEGQ